MKDTWAGKVHERREPGSTYALCGAGAPWSSSIAFTKEDRPVTCRSCLDKMEDVK